MKIETFVGQLEVISSGNIFVPNSDTFRIKIEDLEFIFQFNDLSDDAISTEIIDDKMILKFGKALSDPAGKGIYQPWLLGTVEEHEIFIAFNIKTKTSKAGAVARLIEYCLYKGKEVINE